MPTEQIIIDYKNKSGQIKCSDTLLKLIRNKFSVINPSYHGRKFEPRKFMITPSGAFQVGMWNDIHQYIISLSLAINLTITKEFQDQFQPKLDIQEISKIDGFNYYDYQEISLQEFIKNGRGISILATSAGKTLVLGGLCKSVLARYPFYKILIIVPNIGLLSQTYYSFLDEFDIDNIERWGDDNIPTWTKNIIIANSQILTSNIQETLKKVKNYNVVIVDEVHRIGEKKNQISKVIHNIDTPFKFGLTGTLPDNLLSAWNVIGKIGPVLYEKSSYELRQQGTITDVEVKVIKCIHSTQPPLPPPPIFPNTLAPSAYYEEEIKFIINHPKRNNLIKKICEQVDGNILVLVDRTIYGDNLLDTLKDSTKKCFFIRGKTETEDRDIIKALMETETNIVCVAMSSIFSTGVSIKNLHYALFAYIGKSNVKVIQSIGRTLRKHPTKDKAIIYDIADDLKYSEDHLDQRKRHYQKQIIDVKTKEIKL